MALVTGAGRGIGREIALTLAAAGAASPSTTSPAKSLPGHGGRRDPGAGRSAMCVMGDVGDEEASTAMVERVETELGPLSIVVNNAGITRDNVVMTMSPDDFDAVVRTHLRGTFLVSKAAARKMFRRRRDAIVNISSVVGRRGNAGQANYAAAKAGHHRPHQVAGQGARRAQHPRQRGGAGLHRHADDPGAVRGGEAGDRRGHAAARHRPAAEDVANAVAVSRFAAGAVHYRVRTAGRRRPRH